MKLIYILYYILILYGAVLYIILNPILLCWPIAVGNMDGKAEPYIKNP